MADEIDRKTQETAKKLFSGGVKMDPPYRTWKAFDRDLANDFSRFITGNLYSGDELKLHVNAALNVGCDPKKLTELFFQVATYAGMPAVNEALAVYRDVLTERGEWPIQK
jgi:4-carboxymuconolactone decarboxylase